MSIETHTSQCGESSLTINVENETMKLVSVDCMAVEGPIVFTLYSDPETILSVHEYPIGSTHEDMVGADQVDAYRYKDNSVRVRHTLQWPQVGSLASGVSKL